MTSCQSIKDAYQTYYQNTGSSDITSKSTYTCSEYEVGSVIKNGFGNSQTLVVGNISIRDGYVTNLLTKIYHLIMKTIILIMFVLRMLPI